MGNAKWVHLTFFAIGLLLILLLNLTIDWVWGYFAQPKDLYVSLLAVGLAGTLTFVGWRNQALFDKVQEIIGELLKVTWPTRKETRLATIVVIITTIIFSLFLGAFDFIWSWATDLIYS